MLFDRPLFFLDARPPPTPPPPPPRPRVPAATAITFSRNDFAFSLSLSFMLKVIIFKVVCARDCAVTSYIDFLIKHPDNLNWFSHRNSFSPN